MGAGLVGVSGLFVTRLVVVGVPFAHAPVLALHLKMGDTTVLEKKIKSNPATPNHAV